MVMPFMPSMPSRAAASLTSRISSSCLYSVECPNHYLRHDGEALVGHLGQLAMVKNGKHVSKGSELGTPRLIPTEKITNICRFCMVLGVLKLFTKMHKHRKRSLHPSGCRKGTISLVFLLRSCPVPFCWKVLKTFWAPNKIAV